ncbi:MAG: 3-phosphoshikimate 1-carboxyvinyltransferase, partial [Planctomycetes bacterium]|nr:3-phosphoshikimate 1-carboxyvinyltransferase [Planctomycetota bacterium]
MTDSIEIQPTGPLHGSIRPPGSKSITNRALVCAALADGESTLRGALDSEDTRVMIDALGQLGLVVDHDPDASTIRVAGCAGQFPASQADLYLANSGTSMRFLSAMVTCGWGVYRLDGTPRMRERPIEDLLKALRRLGADVQSETENGCPPVVAHADGLPGGKATVAGDISSQFLSGLLMVAPMATDRVRLQVVGQLVSQPYVRMTLAVMAAFGVTVEYEDTFSLIFSSQERLARFVIPAAQTYHPTRYEIEPDASAASYFFAAAAVTGGRVTVEGLNRESLQGDIAFCDCLERMGCDVRYRTSSITVTGGPLRGIDVDMNAISDTVQTLSAVALFAKGPTTVTDVAHVRHKETDRLHALVTELRKLGAEVDERPD